MSTRVDGNRKSLKAAADYRLMQFHIMCMSTEGIATLATAASDFLIGTLENKPNINENADVFLRTAAGTGKVICGGSVSLGASLTADSSGHAVTTTSAGNNVIGRALQAGDSGDIIEYLPSNNFYAVT
jgi:hypothetical protein